MSQCVHTACNNTYLVRADAACTKCKKIWNPASLILCLVLHLLNGTVPHGENAALQHIRKACLRHVYETKLYQNTTFLTLNQSFIYAQQLMATLAANGINSLPLKFLAKWRRFTSLVSMQGSINSFLIDAAHLNVLSWFLNDYLSLQSMYMYKQLQ